MGVAQLNVNSMQNRASLVLNCVILSKYRFFMHT